MSHTDLGGDPGRPSVSQALQRLGLAILEQCGGPREEARIRSLLAQAEAVVRRNLERGQVPPADGLFGEPPAGDAAGDDIVGAVLLATRQAYEEQKVPYYANLIGNLAFRSDVDRGQASLVVRLVERFSYRQLCLLALLSRRERFSLSDLYPDQVPAAASMGVVGLLHEIR